MAILLQDAKESDPEASVALTGEVSVVTSGTFDDARIDFYIVADGLDRSKLPSVSRDAQFVIKGKTGQTLFAKVKGGSANTSVDVSVT